MYQEIKMNNIDTNALASYSFAIIDYVLLFIIVTNSPCSSLTESSILQVVDRINGRDWAWHVVYIPGPFRTHFWVLEPHLQPLHGHEPSLFVATRGREQTQQVPWHVVHRLPAVQLIPQDVEHVVFHALCQFIVPTVRQDHSEWFVMT